MPRLCDWEGDGDRLVLTVFVDLVVHSELVVRKWRLTAPAVGKDFKTLIDQAFGVKLLKGPEHALGVVLVQGLVVIVKVHPPCLARYIAAPVLGVFQNRGFAEGVELVDPILLNLRPAADAQKSLGLDLSWKPVSVPAETALHPPAPHSLIPRNQVLGVTGEQVPVVREPVSKWRTVIENEFLGSRSRSLIYRLLEGAVFVPVLQHLFFDIGKRRRGNRARFGIFMLWVHHGFRTQS